MNRLVEDSRGGLRTALLGLVAIVANGIAAAEIESDVTLRLAAGHDSNPLLVSGDGPGGAFTQLSFDSRLDVRPSERLGFFLTAGGRARAHGSSTGGADSRGLEARAGLSLPRLGSVAHPLSLAVGAQYGGQRSTYVDRATGKVYEVALPGEPAATAAIGDRLDTESAGAFFAARFAASRRVVLSFDGSVQHVDYLEDYEAIDGLERLDYRGLSVEPGVLVRLRDDTTVAFSLVLSDLDYAGQAAADERGARVPGTTSSYRTVEYRFLCRLEPGDRWKTRFGFRQSERRDLFAHYYDYGATTGFAIVERAIGAKSGLQVSLVHRDLSYDHATVSGSPEADAIASDLRSVSGRFDRELSAGFRWFAEGGRQTVGSSDPVFAYDRQWLGAGIEFRR